MIRELLVGALAPVLVSACAATGPGAGGPRSQPPGPTEREAVLIAATADGALVADIASDAYRGFDRSGRQVWADGAAVVQGAEAICSLRCPDAVLSGSLKPAGPDPEPRLVEAGTGRGLPLSGSPVRRVLSARSASDLVVSEGTRLRLIRDGAPEVRIAVGPGVNWVENARRTAAVAFSPTSGSPLLRFRRDGKGWVRDGTRPERTPSGRTWGACVAGRGPGQKVVLVGSAPRLVHADGRQVALRTDLTDVGECGLGDAGGFVLGRTVDGAGRRRTTVRGIDTAGVQTWSRNIDGEASVAVHPSGETTAIAHAGDLEVVDRRGRTTGRSKGAVSARYTDAGELVTLGADGRVRWAR